MKEIKAKGATLADALTGIKEQAQARRLDVNNPQDCKFAYRQEGAGWSVYLQSNTHEILSGVFATERQAREACEACNKTKQAQPLKVSIKPKHSKISTPIKQQIQAVCLNLDPVRRVRFRETMISINYLLHMLTAAIDENAELFDIMFNNEGKQRVKTINKQLDAVLDAVYQSKVMGDTDDYLSISNAANDMRERFEYFVNYIASEGWRLEALDKTADNVLPDSYIDAKRLEIAEKMKMSVIGETPIQERKC